MYVIGSVELKECMVCGLTGGEQS